MQETKGRIHWGAFLGIAVTACNGGLAPVESPQPPLADAVQVSAAEALVESVFGTPALQSLGVLGPILRVSNSSAAFQTPNAALLSCSADRADPTRPPIGPLTLPFPATGASPLGNVIPDSLQGYVFEYDSAAHAYQVGADSGGPVTGVRFLLYTIGVSGLPASPLQTDGWLDITGADSTVLKLQSHVVNGALPNADYSITARGIQSADTGTLVGIVMAGTDTFVFTDSTARAGTEVVVTSTIASRRSGLQLRLAATHTAIDPYDGFYNFDFTFTRPPETVRLTGSITTYCLIPTVDVAVSVDDVSYASIGPGPGAVAPSPTGAPSFGADQRQAVLDLLYGEERLFTWQAGMFTPASQFLPP